MSDKCTCHVFDGFRGFKDCGRPAKGTNCIGKPACGIHLAAERRADEAQRKRDAQWAERDAKRTVAERAASDFTARTGVLAAANRDGWSTIVVSISDAALIADRLEAITKEPK